MNWRHKLSPGHNCPTVHEVYVKAWCVFIFCCRIQLWIWLAQVLCSLWRWWGPKLWPDTHCCCTSGFSEMSYAGLYYLKHLLNFFLCVASILRVYSRDAVFSGWQEVSKLHCCFIKSTAVRLTKHHFQEKQRYLG